MKNKIEYFIEEHREEFDDEIPNPGLWEKVDRKRSKRKFKWVDTLSLRQMVASVILLLSGIAIIILIQQEGHKNVKGISPALSYKESQEPGDNYYENDIRQMTQMIEIKQNQLKEIKTTDPKLYKDFISSIGQLSLYYRNLEEELKTNPNKDQLLEAMIQNLKLQQELLNQQLSIYKKVKQSKNETRSKNI